MMLTKIFQAAIILSVITLSASCCRKDDLPNITEVSDFEGNTYNVVRIGDQLWTVQSLRTNHLNDGTAILQISDSMQWVHANDPAMCYYNNSETEYKETYGALYNWYTVATGKICPDGWHVPSSGDWDKLISFAGGQAAAGLRLKESGNAHWQDPNEADNSSGFTALPGGHRIYYKGTYSGIGKTGMWASSTLGEGKVSVGVRFYGPIVYGLNSQADAISKVDLSASLPFNGKNEGVSIRCVID
jgi:uncharacterized protein (TIGR02145 family)